MGKKQVDLSFLAQKWTSAIVAREKITEFTGGLMSPGRIANLDVAGDGPPRIRFAGRKVGYPVNQLVTWLEGRAEAVSSTKKQSASAVDHDD